MCGAGDGGRGLGPARTLGPHGAGPSAIADQVFPQVGSFVSRVDAGKVADAQFIREAIELAALDDISGEPDPGLVADLRHNLDRQRATDIEVDEFFALDEQFHQGLLGLSGHPGHGPSPEADQLGRNPGISAGCAEMISAAPGGVGMSRGRSG